MKSLTPILLGLAIAGCGPSEASSTQVVQGERVRGGARVGGEVVSTIDGHAITLADVEHAARIARVTPEVALGRLQDELLLAHAASRAGHLADGPAVSGGARRAMVQAFLAEAIEGEPVPMPSEEALVAAYQADIGRFDAPERRASVHVVARVDENPDELEHAERWIRELHASLSEGPDPESEILAMQRQAHDELPFTVEIEEITELARDADSEESYLAALFEVDAPRLVPEPVRTAFGWHVIVCTAIQPARATSREDAVEIIRGEAIAAGRARRLMEMQAELVESGEIVVRPDFRALLSNPRITEPAR